jgi:hypothetical protein
MGEAQFEMRNSGEKGRGEQGIFRGMFYERLDQCSLIMTHFRLFNFRE